MKEYKYLRIITAAVCMIFMMSACNYLDLVPEDEASMETAFSNRVNTEKYLFTCYSYIPSVENGLYSHPAMIGGDELWWDQDYNPTGSSGMSGISVAQGYQETNDPWQNYWDGTRGGRNLFQAIRDCNIFLENVTSPRDIGEYERSQWIAEAKFLKAWYHFFLLRLYGPIPIIRENLPVSASPDEVRLYREPVGEVIDYIVELIDEAAPDLPLEIANMISEAGRITRPIALAVKAQALVWAASPLFNNDEYANFIDGRGIRLIPGADAAAVKAKWEQAATATKAAIDIAREARHGLFQYQPPALATLSPETLMKLALRGVVTEKFGVNSEIIWGSTRSTSSYQHDCIPILEAGNYNGYASEIGATLRMAELYYTKNGLPIDEDPSWNYADRYQIQRAAADHQYYIGVNQITAKLNFNREPRFYASLGHDRGIYEGSGRTTEDTYFCLEARQGEVSGMRSSHDHVVTGYYVKKIVHPETAFNSPTSQSVNSRAYSFPIIRLADLYLMYAEALNEANGPSAEVYKWIDTIRHRSGIPGVEESYAVASSQARNKPYSTAGLRDIIKRERLIELAFEGQRFWDLRRWKDALQYYNQPIRGWNYREDTPEKYYQVTTVWEKRVFTTRDYLWPLSTHSIVVNSNLMQNPGW
jgi:hypothetical protein